ncbi:hypothetical protein NADFUDRAFT_41725 [Nadsonia fulvescens var. elongata DSM 6958]|uniref:Structure-specific endonuclease subunit SLX4 n=1 Tax=Nadsonia fulvescens var. elongata DSM 6958 TaxID=857566 RepID=A0A1E3PJX5_9ASCO|nr:hypothetical protein NADFUDRAFT_41725 [Nadsonia fulvescens var. elongata DSM 6958]
MDDEATSNKEPEYQDMGKSNVLTDESLKEESIYEYPEFLSTQVQGLLDDQDYQAAKATAIKKFAFQESLQEWQRVATNPNHPSPKLLKSDFKPRAKTTDSEKAQLRRNAKNKKDTAAQRKERKKPCPKSTTLNLLSDLKTITGRANAAQKNLELAMRQDTEDEEEENYSDTMSKLSGQKGKAKLVNTISTIRREQAIQLKKRQKLITTSKAEPFSIQNLNQWGLKLMSPREGHQRIRCLNIRFPHKHYHPDYANDTKLIQDRYTELLEELSTTTEEGGSLEPDDITTKGVTHESKLWLAASKFPKGFTLEDAHILHDSIKHYDSNNDIFSVFREEDLAQKNFSQSNDCSFTDEKEETEPTLNVNIGSKLAPTSNQYVNNIKAYHENLVRSNGKDSSMLAFSQSMNLKTHTDNIVDKTKSSQSEYTMNFNESGIGKINKEQLFHILPEVKVAPMVEETSVNLHRQRTKINLDPETITVLEKNSIKTNEEKPRISPKPEINKICEAGTEIETNEGIKTKSLLQGLISSPVQNSMPMNTYEESENVRKLTETFNHNINMKPDERRTEPTVQFPELMSSPARTITKVVDIENAVLANRMVSTSLSPFTSDQTFRTSSTLPPRGSHQLSMSSPNSLFLSGFIEDSEMSFGESDLIFPTNVPMLAAPQKISTPMKLSTHDTDHSMVMISSSPGKSSQSCYFRGADNLPLPIERTTLKHRDSIITLESSSPTTAPNVVHIDQEAVNSNNESTKIFSIISDSEDEASEALKIISNLKTQSCVNRSMDKTAPFSPAHTRSFLCNFEDQLQEVVTGNTLPEKSHVLTPVEKSINLTNSKFFTESTDDEEPPIRMPDFASFTIPELKAKIDAYGFKPVRGGRAPMIALLEECERGKAILKRAAVARSYETTQAETRQDDVRRIYNRISQLVRSSAEEVAQAPIWWARILIYEPLILEDFHKFVSLEGGLDVDLNLLKSWCDEVSVTVISREEREMRRLREINKKPRRKKKKTKTKVTEL